MINKLRAIWMLLSSVSYIDNHLVLNINNTYLVFGEAGDFILRVPNKLDVNYSLGFIGCGDEFSTRYEQGDICQTYQQLEEEI